MQRKPIQHTLTAFIIAAPLTISGLAVAQSSTMSTKDAMPSSSKVMSMDKTFFKKAAIGGMTEVEAGKLAASQGSSDEVKAFGQKMVDDHTKADDDLKTLAEKQNVTLPTAPDPMHQAMLNKLKAKHGKAFDTAFISDMKKGHADAIKLFTAEGKSKDSDLAQFASTTLPVLKDHQAHIPKIAMMDGKTTMGGATPAP